MGNEPSRKGKRLCIHLAGCLMAGLCLWSCTAGITPPWQADRPSPTRHLALGECLLAQGDYAGAQRQAKLILQRFPGQADDRALLLLGMVGVHPDNPRDDTQDGAEAFRRLVADYPDSPLVVDARTWLAFVANLEESKRTVQALQTQNQILEERLDSEKQQRLKLEERLQQMKAVDLTVE